MNELIQIGPISPLRQRLIDDMAMRRFSKETQRNYLRDVGRFATWLGRSPHTASAEEVRQFQIDQQQAGVPVPTMNSIVSALRFFFTETLDRPDLARNLVRTRQVRKIPVVLTMAEVKRLLDAPRCLTHPAALSVAYGAGLRVAEVAALKISDVDSKRMLLRIERGKGGRYRNAMLPEGLLLLLRDWWRVALRELPTGMTLGAILGIIGFIRVIVWQQAGFYDYGQKAPYLLVALNTFLALVGLVTFGSMAGSMLPFLLQRIGFDPATASAPFVATLVDVTGLVIYFSVALLILRGTLL